MARQKLTADNFTEHVNKILEEYEENIVDNVGEISLKIGKNGAQAIKNDANTTFSDVHLPKGRYGSGWKAEITEQTRLKTVVTIHNAKYPGLPHLLEYGHLTRNGKRTTPRPHIKPVEDQITKEFEAEVVAKL